MLDFLHLQDIRSRHVEDCGDHYKVEAEGGVIPTTCPTCHNALYRHGSQRQTYLDTPMHGKRKGLSPQEMKDRLVSIQDHWANTIRFLQWERDAGRSDADSQEKMVFARQMLDRAVSSEIAIGKIRVNLLLPLDNRAEMEKAQEDLEKDILRMESIIAENPQIMDALKEKTVSIQDAFLTYLNTLKPQSQPDADYERRVQEAAEVLHWAIEAEGILAAMRVKIALKEGSESEMLDALNFLENQIMEVGKGVL